MPAKDGNGAERECWRCLVGRLLVEREREKVSGKRENDRILVSECQGRMRRGKVRMSVKERESAIKRESSCG